MKKKGLIISTIVMVVVLVASLSTATFAWFSSTAQATVSQIAINTQASKGLQVAVKNSSDYYYGEVTYDAVTGLGGTAGWGSDVNFSAITDVITGSLGTMDSAVTVVKTGKVDANGVSLVGHVYSTAVNTEIAASYTLVNGQPFTEAAVNAGVAQVKTTDGVSAVTTVATTDNYNASAKYYIPNTTFDVGDYIIPIGYNDVKGDMVPYGYIPAVANEKYLDLPISVRPTVNVSYIFCTLTLTPKRGDLADSSWTNFKPAMAAASFIEIRQNTSEANPASVILEPYNTSTLGQSAISNPSENPFVFKFVVAHNTAENGIVAASSVIDYSYRIWIEGTDSECKNITAGSMFDINIDYDYAIEKTGVDETSISDKTAITSGYAKNNAGTQIAGVPMASITPEGYVTYIGKQETLAGAAAAKYYILSITKDFKA